MQVVTREFGTAIQGISLFTVPLYRNHDCISWYIPAIYSSLFVSYTVCSNHKCRKSGKHKLYRHPKPYEQKQYKYARAIRQSGACVSHPRKDQPTNCDAPLEQSRQLVAQRFPPASPHDDENVPPRQGGIDDLLLVGAPAVQAEGVPQKLGHGLGPLEVVLGPVALREHACDAMRCGESGTSRPHQMLHAVRVPYSCERLIYQGGANLSYRLRWRDLYCRKLCATSHLRDTYHRTPS